MNNTQTDDLQSAIDGIVNARKDAAAPAAATDTSLPDLGVPPVPPMPPMPGAPVETAANTGPAVEVKPEEASLGLDATKAVEEATKEVDSLAPDTAEPAPAVDAAAPIIGAAETAPAAEVTPAAETSELSAVKESMIEDLLPIIDKVNVEPEKKFELYKDIIDSKHDKSKVPAAYEAAKGITDETKKAEALLYLIDEA